MAALARSSQPEEDAFAAAVVALSEASIAAAEGDRRTVLARFQLALALLTDQRFEVDIADARLAFARALRDLGQELGARDEFGRAREIFARMDAVGMVATINRELSEMKEAGSAGLPSDVFAKH
jgi:hypothetical protein